MDVVAIVFQIICTILGSLTQSLFDRFCNKKYSKEKMCQNYLQSLENINQANSINDSFNDSFNNTNVQGNIAVIQKNVSIKHNTNIKDSSNKSSASNAIVYFMLIVILITVVCLFFLGFILYLKEYVYFDYWYLFLIVILSVIACSIYYNTICENNDLYWNLDKFRSTLSLILFLTLISNLSITMPENVENLNKILEENINNFTDIFHLLELIDYSSLMNEIVYLAFRYSILIVPMFLIIFEIITLIKNKKSFLTSTSFVLFIFGIIYFFPDLLYYLGNL